MNDLTGLSKTRDRSSGAPAVPPLVVALLALGIGSCGSFVRDAGVADATMHDSMSDTPRHTFGGRPIVVRDDRTFVWAAEQSDGADPEYFDFTDSAIEPARLDHGIGRDTIAAVESPEFAALADPRLAELGIDGSTSVLGVRLNGVAKAYPVSTMIHHEIVNDSFGGDPFAVLW